MPSIRRSLIAYFLIILAVALAALGILVDVTANDAIRQRQEASTLRIEQEYTYRCAQSATKFDEELLEKAHSLGGEFRRIYNAAWNSAWSRGREEGDRLNALTNLMVSSLSDTGLARNNTQVLLNYHTRLPILAGLATSSRLEEVRRYFVDQYDRPNSRPYLLQFHIPRWHQSVIITRESGELPGDVENHGLTTVKEHDFENVFVAGVGECRRVIYRTNLLGSRPPIFAPRPGSGGRPPSGGGAAARPPEPPRFPQMPQEVQYPALYVQVANPVSSLENSYAEHTQVRDKQLQALNNETNTSLARLRFRVVLISLVTFVALAIGGWWLVGLGLAPVRKLSDAAGRVSEKDFRLPVEKEELSSELSPIHDRLTHSLDALRAAFEREKQAVADISHELRTPVAALLTTIEVSLRKPRTVEQYKATMEECRSLTKQLGSLVERVMTLAYLDAGQAPVSLREADISELAEGCAAMIRPIAAEHGISLKADLEHPTEIRTDPDKVREVMMNLLHNAVEYNKPGGQIELRVKCAPSGGATLEVADTGIGMSSEVKHRIFERFYRADPSRTATGVHAGLGLAIVKEYVSRIGGTIAVESEPGQGSTFRVLLPANVS